MAFTYHFASRRWWTVSVGTRISASLQLATSVQSLSCLCIFVAFKLRVPVWNGSTFAGVGRYQALVNVVEHILRRLTLSAITAIIFVGLDEQAAGMAWQVDISRQILHTPARAPL